VTSGIKDINNAGWTLTTNRQIRDAQGNSIITLQLPATPLPPSPWPEIPITESITVQSADRLFDGGDAFGVVVSRYGYPSTNDPCAADPSVTRSAQWETRWASPAYTQAQYVRLFDNPIPIGNPIIGFDEWWDGHIDDPENDPAHWTVEAAGPTPQQQWVQSRRTNGGVEVRATYEETYSVQTDGHGDVYW
jgi:hypothetical protein